MFICWKIYNSNQFFFSLSLPCHTVSYISNGISIFVEKYEEKKNTKALWKFISLDIKLATNGDTTHRIAHDFFFFLSQSPCDDEVKSKIISKVTNWSNKFSSNFSMVWLRCVLNFCICRALVDILYQVKKPNEWHVEIDRTRVLLCLFWFNLLLWLLVLLFMTILIVANKNPIRCIVERECSRTSSHSSHLIWMGL